LFAAGFDGMHAAPGQLRKTRGIEGFIGIEDIDQVVWDDVALSHAGFCCANIQETINLAGIAPDDLSVKVAGESEAEISLADSSGADNDRDWTCHRSL
jgi:hypothetical protein